MSALKRKSPLLLMAAAAVLLVPLRIAAGDRDALPARFRTWLGEEVFYIITSTEKEVFLKLTSDRDREMFIEAFWRHRDPSPGTEANEFREEHYRRLAYAERRFRGGGKPGWKTDRGRVYILLGEPLTVRSFDGRTDYYPAEMWSYQGIEGYGLPQAFHLLFYQPGGIGDYTLFNPGVEGPWTLIRNYDGDIGNIAEAFAYLEVIEPDLARASLSLVPGEGSLTVPSLASAQLLQNIDAYAVKKVADKYARRFLDYKDIVEVDYSANFIDGDALVKIFRDEEGLAWVHLALEPSRLSMGEEGGRITTLLEINGRLADEAGRTMYQFDRRAPLRFTGDEFARMRDRPMDFTGAFPVLPGRYRFSLLLKNAVSKEFMSVETTLAVPENRGELEMSELLLAFNARTSPADERVIRPFAFEGVQFYGQPGNAFIPADTLLVYFQLSNLPPALARQGRLRYAFRRDDLEHASLDQPVAAYPSAANVQQSFPLAGFPPGYYTLTVTLAGPDGREIASRREPFVVSPLAYLPRPWIQSDAPAGQSSARARTALGTQYLNRGDFAGAAAELRRAEAESPGRTEVIVPLARAEAGLGRPAEAARLLEPLIGGPEESYEVMLIAGRASYEAGSIVRAKEVFGRALDRFGVNVDLLNALGDCHLRLDEKAEALAAFERSLALNPDQPAIKERAAGLRK